MSNRLFHGVIHQMKDAIDRTIGVVDEGNAIIACSELTRIGEHRNELADCNARNQETFVCGGYTYRVIGVGSNKSEYYVFVEGEDKAADKTARLLAISLSNIKNLYDEK